MTWLTDTVVALNAVANAAGRVFAPIAVLPGWLSITLISIVTGVGLLLMFKYTSNQRAIKQVRREMRANRLTGSLFKDRVWLGFRSQGRVLIGAVRLLLLALVPVLVMTVPVVLLLGQLSLWYQARPLPVGAETTITVKLNGDATSPLPAVVLEPTPAVEVAIGPVRVASQREVCWRLAAREPGTHTLRFATDGRTFEKEIAIGDDFRRVSPLRPGRDWIDVLLNPHEKPFAADSPVRSIEIEYPERPSRTSGTDSWVIYWFIVSLVAGFLLRHRLGVNL